MEQRYVIGISSVQYVLTGLLCMLYNIGFGVYIGYKAYIIGTNVDSTLQHPWLLVIYGCECMFFISGLITMIEVLIPPSKRAALKLPDQGPLPHVDVFVTCCKEKIDVIKDTLRSVLAQTYPDNRFTVYVLDDGKDAALLELCETMQLDMGVSNLKYLSRDKQPGVPHHFKAGNINFGMARSTSEYITILDADMIVHPDMLRYMLPHIINAKDVAYVQTPQCFYNIRPGDPLSDSQPLWYHNILVHRDTINFASCCGTGVMFRRSALDKIGGFQTESITEDALTSMLLFSKGYKSVYLNYKLQMGLAPWTFRGYLAQRDRWARGALQLAWPITRKVIWNCSSKLGIYKHMMLNWYFMNYVMYAVNLVMVASLICVLAFNWTPYPGTEDDGRTLLFFLAPVFVLWRLYWVMSWIHIPHAFQQRNRDEQQYWWMTPYMCEMMLDFIWNTLFSWCSSGFKFISTGSIDGSNSRFAFLFNIWKVKWHLLYITGVCTLVVLRIVNLDFTTCKNVVFVLGISMFLVLVAVYMLVPIPCALFPNRFKAKKREQLLVYDSQGVPIFDPKRTVPDFALHTLMYEIITWLITGVWLAYFFAVLFNYDVTVCQNLRSYCDQNNC